MKYQLGENHKLLSVSSFTKSSHKWARWYVYQWLADHFGSLSEEVRNTTIAYLNNQTGERRAKAFRIAKHLKNNPGDKAARARLQCVLIDLEHTFMKHAAKRHRPWFDYYEKDELADVMRETYIRLKNLRFRKRGYDISGITWQRGTTMSKEIYMRLV